MFHATRVPRAAYTLLGLLTMATVANNLGATGAAPAGEATAASNGGQAATETAVGPDALGFDEIVFVKRKPFSSDHYYTDINSGTSPDRFLADNGIYVYNLRTRSERAVLRAAAMPGGNGLIGKISLSRDAKKIIFDFRQDPGAGFRVWEVNADGTGLRQVSFPPPDETEKAARWRKGWHTDDIHPCYLPDGKIIFSSTRGEHTVLCGGSAQSGGARSAPHERRRRPCGTAHE